MQLLMSDKARNYSKVIEQFEQGQLTRRQAAALMRCSERHVSRLRKAYRASGDAAFVHRLRGRPSNRRRNEQELKSAVELVSVHYADFGPTLAAEKLAQCHGLQVSRECLRQALIAAGLWRDKPRKSKPRQWRERKACLGELLQMDTSEHDWFEGRGEHAELILMIDDASSRAYMRFAAADTSESNMAVLYAYMQLYGRPQGLYTDKASHFVVNRPASLCEQLEGQQPQTQIGRALAELSINLVIAHSPQAKGRVERCFGTAQDRLVKEMRLAQISTIEAANRFLDEHYLPWWNAYHTVLPASPVDAHRSLEALDLQAILSHQEPRQVQNDYTIQYDNQRYQILKASQLPNLRKNKVTVQKRLDGTLCIWAKGQYLQTKALPPSAGAAAPPPLGLRPLSGEAAPETVATPQGRQLSPKAHKPAPDHPWRNPKTREYFFGRRDIST
jgi:hypothetical protein